MNKILTVATISFFAIALILGTSLTNSHAINKTEKKALNKIIGAVKKNLVRETEGKPSSVCVAGFTKANNLSVYIPFYNKTSCYTQPIPNPPPVPICKPDEHLEGNKCVKNQPNPKPGNGSVSTSLLFVGDLEPCDKVHSALKDANPDWLIALGDLGYQKTLDCFTQNYKDFKDEGKLKCDIGNHETTEDAGSKDPVIKQAHDYCGEYWSQKVNNNTLVIGADTNGDFKSIITWGSSILTDTNGIMKGVKNVIFTWHKPCYVFPNAHHTVEKGVKAFCDAMTANVPQGVNVYYVAAHDHDMAATKDFKKFISGGGGGNKYACGSDADWNYCNNKDDGFLKALIDDKSGGIIWSFFNIKGSMLKSSGSAIG